MRYINENLPDDARISLILLGGRGYYMDRPYHIAGMNALKRMVKASKDGLSFQTCLQLLHCTHILMRTDLVNKYLQDNFSREEIEHFINLAKKYWKLVYESNGYAVMEVRSEFSITN
ncbi:MAG: hypothetical protein KKC73_02665 [Proteobacteria bacterium]|nr:hypothetical protein [Pseudomonadota bacterium]